MTLCGRGVPVLFEALGSPDDLGLIYANQSLEASASAEFGGPLPGRQFSIERGVNNATPACRCMPPEAGELDGQSFYELVPADVSGTVPPATRLATVFPRRFLGEFTHPAERLSRSPRLPGSF